MWLATLLRRMPGCSLGHWTQPEDSVPSDADKETIKKHAMITDVMLINTLVLLVVVGIAENFIHGVWLARESIISGKGWEALHTFRQYLQQRKPAE